MSRRTPAPADLPKRFRLSSDFTASFSAAKAAQDLPAVDLLDLPRVGCRRCKGKGYVDNKSGPAQCAGHNATGCVNGRALTPAGQTEFHIRNAQRALDGLRAAYRALRTVTPTSQREAKMLASEIEKVTIAGKAARANLEAAPQEYARRRGVCARNAREGARS